MGISGVGGGGAIGLAAGNQIVSPGILSAISIATTKIFQPVGELWWSIHLAAGPDEEDGVLFTFVQGYIQWPSTLSWSGFMEVKEGQYFIVNAVGVQSQVGQVIDTRLTLTRDGALTDYLVQVIRGKKTA